MNPVDEMTPEAPARAAGSAPDRRGFLTTAALATAGVAAVGMLMPSSAMAVSPPLTFGQVPGTGDIKVLNFALSLEALEAELYRQAVARLSYGGTDNFGKKIHALNISPKQRHAGLISEFYKVEVEHRNFLEGALGAASILKTPAFKNVKFDFNINSLDQLGVLQLVYTAEKIGVSAYLGAIPYLSTKTYLQTAGAIQGTEARHTAAVADLIRDFFPSAASSVEIAPSAAQNGGKDTPLSPDAVLAAVSPFIVL